MEPTQGGNPGGPGVEVASARSRDIDWFSATEARRIERLLNGNPLSRYCMGPDMPQTSERRRYQIAPLWKAGSSEAGARSGTATLRRRRRCVYMVSCEWNKDDHGVLEQWEPWERETMWCDPETYRLMACSHSV